jgi:hypothetical protein
LDARFARPENGHSTLLGRIRGAHSRPHPWLVRKQSAQPGRHGLLDRGDVVKAMGYAIRLGRTRGGSVMKDILRGAITFAAFLVLVALLLALDNRAPWVDKVFAGFLLACVFVGSVVKLWRVVIHGDFSVTSDAFWLPRRLRACMNLELSERRPAPHGQEAENSKLRHMASVQTNDGILHSSQWLLRT